jgi:hypothetical protein
LLDLAAGSSLAARLGFLLLVFFLLSCLAILLNIFLDTSVDSLLHNALLMPDLFGLRTDLIKDDVFFFVFPLLPLFVLLFFLYSFLLQVPLLPPVQCAAFLSFASRPFFLPVSASFLLGSVNSFLF